jgi:hypothetical protein
LIFFEEIERKGFKFKWAPLATAYWEMRPDLSSTFRRFLLYSCVNVWAKRQRNWHHAIAKMYAISVPFIVLAAWKSWWWLLVPAAGFAARVGKRIWLRRDGRGILFALNPARFGYVAIITMAIDLAMFTGWIQALFNRREMKRVADQMRTRRGE